MNDWPELQEMTMKPWLWMALLWMGLAAVWPTAHATEAERPLSLMLLPPIAGKGSPQLAISWKGEQAGQLELSVVDADGQRRRLKSRALEPGMHLDGVELSEQDARLVAVLRDAAGRELARAESAARPGVGAADETLRTAPTPQPKGGTLDWKATFTGNDGPNGTVYAMTVYDDGTGPALVIGGDFTTAGGTVVNRIARWNGSGWSALSTGISGTVRALSVYGGELIAGGFFTNAGGIAVNNVTRWNGSAWSALGTGVNSQVQALTVYGGALIAGGDFTSAGGTSAILIASWNGSMWSALGSGMNASVRALTVFDGELIAGGSFTLAGGVTGTNYIARWNGSAWSALGSGMNSSVFALSTYGGELIVGGDFTSAGGIAANRIARWNGSTWSALGIILNGPVTALTVYDGQLIAGGGFFFAAVNGFATNIARWNGTTWFALGEGMNSVVRTLTEYNDDLIAGGDFTTAGGVTANRIARWNDSAWSALGVGMNGEIRAQTVYLGELIAAGTFTSAGGVTVNRIARWNGSAWSALGSGMDSDVVALMVYGNELIAAGSFTTAGGVIASRIARWNGSAWSALGTGTNGTVEALTVYGGELVVGGSFTDAGGVANTNRIARWNGSGWSSLGVGMDGSVFALSVYNGELIVGGTFSYAGLVYARSIARWDGSMWSSLGLGHNGAVLALTVHGGDLIAGGSFWTTLGTFNVAKNIARWNGSAWSRMDQGLSGSVDDLTTYGGNLIAGGAFTMDGYPLGVTLNRIARWNGTSWSALGSGMDGGVYALTVHNNVLIAGGTFSSTGVVASPSIAAYGVADLTVTEITSTHPSPSRAGEPVRIRARVTASTAPTVGHITITGSPGGSCSDLTLTPVNDTTSEAECTIRWSTAGARTLTASYIGGADWMPSTSAGYAHTVDAATEDWRPMFVDAETGLNGRVNAAVLWDDGSGPALVVGGGFTAAGTTALNRVAKWNGSRWVPLGDGVNGTVWALAVHNGALIAGGEFTAAAGVSGTSRIARWTGSAWQALGTGVNDTVWALTPYGTDLVAGGSFTNASGAAGTTRIARWNGSAWNALGTGMNSVVWSLAATGSTLYAGGSFDNAGGTAANRVARWNGSSWSALGSGTNGAVYALALSGSDVYAAGAFTSAAGVANTGYIARWNGSAWSALGTGGSATVYALTVSGSNLVAGGEFTTMGGVAANRAAIWNGSSWNALGAGTNAPIYTLALQGTNVIAGGDFLTAGTVGAGRIAQWDGTQWDGLGSVLNGEVRAATIWNDGNGPALYVGGTFTTAGGKILNHVGRWDGESWTSLGTGTNGWVYALEEFGGALHAAGFFTTAGGSPASYIARWDGSNWLPLTSGLSAPALVLSKFQDRLMVGGTFTSAGGVAGSAYLAQWNGTAWSALGAGVNNQVFSLGVHRDLLYAGGFFTSAGGAPANYIARWNGSAWSALGSGTNAEVRAITSLGEDLIIGGGFTSAGGVAGTAYVARWNGSAWSGLGTGMNDLVFALTRRGNEVVAGGRFTLAGGVAANRLARWNGSAWSAMGSGLANTPFVLLSDRDSLVIGGEFLSAFGRASPYLSAFGPTTTTTLAIQSSTPNPSGTGQAVTLTARVSGRVAPSSGTVTFVGIPSGSCSDLTLTAFDDTTSEASCTLTFNNPGVQQMTARYDGAALPGDFGHLPGTSSVYSHVVASGPGLPTTTSISSVAPSSISVGRPYWVSVVVTSSSGTPTGAIEISDGFGSRCGPISLSADGSASCFITSHEPGLKTLRAVYVPTGSFSGSSGTASISVTSNDRWIYSNNVNTGQIRRLRLDGTSDQLIASPTGLANPAWDPLQQHIYHTSGNTTIRRINPDGSGGVTILSAPVIAQASFGLAIDYLARKIYWGEENRIRRANLDGSAIETIQTGLAAVRGIALDLEAGKLYWGDAFGGYRRSNLDGSGIESLPSGSGLPFVVAPNAPANQLFYSDYDVVNGVLRRTDLSGGTSSVLLSGIGGNSNLALDYANSRVFIARQFPGAVLSVGFDGSSPATVTSPGGQVIGLAIASLWTPAEPTSTAISSDAPDPSNINSTVPIVVWVSGSTTAPTDGQVQIHSSSGESCIDTTSTPVSGSTIEFSCSIQFESVGVRSLTARFLGSATHATSTSAAESHTVAYLASTTITSVTPPDSQTVGIPYTVRVQVEGGLNPTGTVTVSDGSGATCMVSLPTGNSCPLTSTTTGAKTLTATYSGDVNHPSSVGTFSYTITANPGNPGGLQVGAVVLPATAASPTVNPTVSVTFPQPFNAVPVVIVQPSDENARPQGLRIRNVTATGFEVLQVEPPGCGSCNGSSGAKTVHWLAATPGRYRLEQDTLTPAWLGSALRGTGPGALLIVGQVSTTATQYKSGLAGFTTWPATSWESVSWPSVGGGLDFSTPPVVLTTIQSWANEGANLTAGGLVGASQPWAQSVQRNVSTSGFQLALDAGEVSADDLAPAGFATPEVVGYVAMDANVSQALLPVGGPPTVGLVSGSVAAGVLCRTVDLDFPLGTAIDAANFRGFAGKQSRAIPDGGWLRRCQLTNPAGQTVRIGFRREEDQAFDSGDPALRSPIEDQAGTVAFSGNFTTTPVTLAEMSVSRVGSEIDVRWTTATEVAQLGYRLWGRARSGEWRLLTPELIGATAGERMSAASYSARVPAAGVDEVRLEDMDVLGHARFHPAVAVGESRGAAPTESSIDWSAIRTENAAVMSARAAAPTSATASALARVNRDGVQRIAGSALIALDARFAGAPAASLAVLDGERPVWRHVGCTTLTADCTIEFVGQARESRYGAVRAYTVTLDPSAVRTAASGHVQAGSATLRSYASEVRDYSNRLYNASINGPDPWHDARIAATSGPAEVSRSFTLPERVAGAVTLTVDLHGGLDFPDAAPDHHVQLLLNGQQVADRWFDGLRPQRIEVAVPESLLSASNTLTIRVPRDTGYSADVVLLEGYSLRYTRQSRMDGASLAQGRLDPTLTGAAGGEELLRDGFEAVTSGFSGFALAGAPTGTVLWSEVEGRLGRDLLAAGEVRVDNRSSRWLAAAPTSVQSPTLALPATAYSLPGELDYLVIAHPLFADGLQPLLQLQASRGLDTAVITTEAIYAAHSNHVPDPAAIRTAVQAAKARGARFVLLVGGDSYDYHDYLGVGSQSYVPTEYVAANDYLFHAATDAAYADVDGDQQPDLAMGRLPVRTQAELTRVLTSIVARGNALPQQYLAVAGRSDPGENFALHSRASLSLLRQPGQQKRFALADEIGTAAAREQARAGLAGSADWISYQGHSSPSRWAFDNLLDVGQLGSVQRSGLPAVVSQWSCWTNAFVLPTQDTMAHALMLRDNRLAASVIGATSLAEDASHLALAVRFFDLVEDGKLREAEQVTAGTIGEALQQAGRDLLSREPQHAAAVLNIALFGDPAAPIR